MPQAEKAANARFRPIFGHTPRKNLRFCAATSRFNAHQAEPIIHNIEKSGNTFFKN